ncbi:PHP domain-containing protein, partial [Intestinimonas massiliensis]|uniref:PHP domain-containing protein n=1 Tax=Intestinimonas massiliensis (ex Afouda et al. 2020) TaxID=1673721 RepID=UPI00210E7DB1
MSYFIDYHTHSQLSPDSSVPLEQQAEAADRSGLSELCITDHYDTVGLHGGPMEPYVWAPAVEQFQRVRAQFQGRLTLRLGLEF